MRLVLNPTATIEDTRGQEFIPQWETAINAASTPARLLIASVMLSTEEPLGVSDIYTRLGKLQGPDAPEFPIKDMAMRRYIKNWISGTGLCETDRTERSPRYIPTEEGRQILPFLGMFALWQLQYGSVVPVLGPIKTVGDEERYGQLPACRLRTLQEAAMNGVVRIRDIATVLKRTPTQVYGFVDELTEARILVKRDEVPPASHTLELLPGAGSEVTETVITDALRRACTALRVQGRTEVRADELVNEVKVLAGITARTTWRLLKSPHSAPFVHFADQSIYGPPGERGGYSLHRSSYGPIKDLLTGIMSLNNSRFSDAAHYVLTQVVARPGIATPLLELPSGWRHGITLTPLPMEEEKVAPKVAKDPPLPNVAPWIKTAVRAVYRGDDQFIRACRGIEFLATNGFAEIVHDITRAKSDGHAKALVSSSDSRAHLKLHPTVQSLRPMELRAFMRVMGIERLYYGNVIPRNLITDGLKVPLTTSLGDYVRDRILPRLRQYVEQDGH